VRPEQASTIARYVTAGALARALNVARRSVERWCKSGKIQANRTPGGHWRIPREEIDRLLATGADALAA
jgi:excisionase family DNA binding protein